MSAMEIEKIYVRMIDGVEALVPIDACFVSQSHGRYERWKIQADTEYDSCSEATLFEFYPGDVVEVENAEFPDDDYTWKAVEMVTPSSDPERTYWEFQFRAAEHCPPPEAECKLRFLDVIERIKKEKAAGKFFYMGVVEAIKYFEIGIEC